MIGSTWLNNSHLGPFFDLGLSLQPFENPIDQTIGIFSEQVYCAGGLSFSQHEAAAAQSSY